MKSKLLLASSLASALLVGLTACTPPVSGQIVQSGMQRIAAPDVSQQDLATLVKGNNEFALALYRPLGESGGNLFYSPYSISLALAMAYAGARGDTESQMAKTLHYLLPQKNLHAAFNSLDQELGKRGQGAQGRDGRGFRLNIVNAIWGQQGFQFTPAYLDTLATNYGAGLRLLDFIGEADASRITINNWVSDRTEGRIKDLIPPGAIDQLTRLVLTNAIYFNAAWQYPFEKGLSVSGAFHTLTGGDVNVLMMKQTESFAYAEGDNYQAVELPYDGRELSMLILAPQQGQFKAFESALDINRLSEITGSLESRRVALTMPKFEYDSSFGLKDELAGLGMPAAFTDSADFSGMTGECNLHIKDVVHKAFVAVDETGTEAAAATAVIMAGMAAPSEPVVLTIDRPFIFLIRDIQTGSIIFIGRVLDPGK